MSKPASDTLNATVAVAKVMLHRRSSPGNEGLHFLRVLG